MEINRDFVRGCTSLFILSLLNQEGSLYGYQITKLIKEKTENMLDYKEGTLYPALYKLEQELCIKSEYTEVNGRKRRNYTITEKGMRQLAVKEKEWHTVTKLVNGVIKYA
jgi:PadR family transcriptional regulator, regulatory protein PadR